MRLLVAVPAAALLAAYLCLVPRFKQFCGEAAVYRIGLGLHACESNDEAADDFACSQDIGGLSEALSFRDLSAQQCAKARPHRFVPWIYRVGLIGN